MSSLILKYLDSFDPGHKSNQRRNISNGFWPNNDHHGTSFKRNLMESNPQELTNDEVMLVSCMSPLRETDPNGS